MPFKTSHKVGDLVLVYLEENDRIPYYSYINISNTHRYFLSGDDKGFISHRDEQIVYRLYKKIIVV